MSAKVSQHKQKAFFSELMLERASFIFLLSSLFPSLPPSSLNFPSFPSFLLLSFCLFLYLLFYVLFLLSLKFSISILENLAPDLCWAHAVTQSDKPNLVFFNYFFSFYISNPFSTPSSLPALFTFPCSPPIPPPQSTPQRV